MAETLVTPEADVEAHAREIMRDLQVPDARIRNAAIGALFTASPEVQAIVEQAAAEAAAKYYAMPEVEVDFADWIR